MKKKTIFIFILAMLILVGACSSSNQEATQNDSAGYDMASSDQDGQTREGATPRSSETAEMESVSSEDAERAPQVEGDGSTSGFAGEDQQRMIIHEHYMNMEVQDLQSVLRGLQREVNNLPGAYVQSLNEWKHESRTSTEHRADITLRIPVNDWGSMEEYIEDLGNILERSMDGQDVTEEYVDLESRLRSQLAHEQRLLELFDRAEDIEDLLKIEQELSRIRTTMEQMEGRQQYLERVTSTVKVSLNLFEVEEHEFTVTQQQDLSLWQEVGVALKASYLSLLQLGERGLVVIAYLFPYLILLSVLAIIAAIFYRQRNRQSKLDNHERTD